MVVGWWSLGKIQKRIRSCGSACGEIEKFRLAKEPVQKVRVESGWGARKNVLHFFPLIFQRASLEPELLPALRGDRAGVG